MKLSLRVEFIDCDMTRQRKYLKVSRYLVEYHKYSTEIVYRDYYIRKTLSRRTEKNKIYITK